MGAYRDSEHVAFLRDRLREEVDRIAEKKGIDFDKADTSSTFGSKVRDRARYSTLQDLDAGRHTEVDMFAGAVVRMGRELGIPTPYNEFTYHMVFTHPFCMGEIIRLIRHKTPFLSCNSD